jgi:adenosylhomocysteine nucleosidase
VIAIFAAMRPEVATCLGSIGKYSESKMEDFPLIEAQDIIICQTGIGPRSRQAADAVISSRSPGVVLSIGVAGGLAPHITAGEVVVCDRIDHESHRDGDRQESVFSDERLIEVTLAAGKGLNLPMSRGASLTVDEAAWGPAEKSAHHSWKAHDIVEMESFWIGEAAARHDVPFLCVRTISDTAEDSLLQTHAMDEHGNFDQQRLLAYIREHPDHTPLIAAQSERGRAAFTNLAIMMAGLLPPLAEHFAVR